MFFSPRWILSHLFVAVLVCAFIAAGFWQLARLDDRQMLNARIESRIDAAPIALADLPDGEPDEVEYTPVQLSGRYGDAEILVANRSNEGTPGFWLWGSFLLDSGGEVLVNRGFIARAVVLESPGAAPLADSAFPAGDVQIMGRIRQGLDDARLSESGAEISRPDPARAIDALGLDAAIDPALYVELITQDPAQTSNMPTPLPAPDLGEGPHLSYAFQWFTFATIGVVGYLLLLRRIRRGDQSKGDVPLTDP